MSATISFSKSLRDTVDEILKTQVTNENTITAVIYSVFLPDLKVRLEDLSLSIHQGFVDNHTDIIKLNFKLTLSNYLYITNLYQDLRCSIVISNNITRSAAVWPMDDIKIDHKIIFTNKDDILKNIPKTDIFPNNLSYTQDKHLANKITIESQLVDDDVFELRKKQYGAIYRNTTLERVIHFLVGKFKPQGKFIIKPDNTTMYDNIVIDGLMPFKDIFHHLDREYGGIYNTGLGYYISQGIFFMYPLYNFFPDNPLYTIHIYMVGNNTFLGSKNYHMKKNGDWHILSNMGSSSTQLMESATENTGNGFMIFRDSILFDKWRKQQDNGSFSVIEDPIIQMQLDNPNTLSGASHNLRYVSDERELSECRSNLSLVNGTIFNIKWDHASPFIIRPGCMIVIHYDGVDTYETKTGICVNANYTYTSQARDGMDRVYVCTASITLLTET